jgi:hypothetical protein
LGRYSALSEYDEKENTKTFVKEQKTDLLGEIGLCLSGSFVVGSRQRQTDLFS